jgi:hypothetical protein
MRTVGTSWYTTRGNEKTVAAAVTPHAEI